MGTTRMRRDEVLVTDLLGGDGPINEPHPLSGPIRGAPVRPQITPLENRAA